MVKKLDIDKIIKNNPKINKEEFRETYKALKKSRKQILVEETRYDIAPPFTTNPRIKVIDEIENDKRCVHILFK